MPYKVVSQCKLYMIACGYEINNYKKVYFSTLHKCGLSGWHDYIRHIESITLLLKIHLETLLLFWQMRKLKLREYD